MNDRRIGQLRLYEMFSLAVPKPFVRSQEGSTRRTIEDMASRREYFPPRYFPEDTAVGHLKFALRYETLDMGVLVALFRAIDLNELTEWIRNEPTGALARRAWFLYEALTGRELDVPDAGVVTYVDALDEKLHVVATGKKSRRHKVNDNLLGVPGFYLTVRRTAKLDERRSQNLDQVAKAYTSEVSPQTLARAIQYLYTKETKSSFEIEHEHASPEKARRFIASLERADKFDPSDIKSLITLQNEIVDPRYASTDLRDFQNFVGETIGTHREKVHFICPKPEDVRPLIDDWISLTARLKRDADPVVAASLIAFTFVFIHPFEDGNGRIHRFMIHHVLSSRGFTPEGIVFPVSAAILRNMKAYDAVLESFSAPLFDFMEWKMTPAREVEVLSATDHLYRYFDATRFVEFIYDKLSETIEIDIRQEVEFVERFDRAYSAVTDIVDMPNRKASLFVRLCMQNAGSLSKNKRDQFKELSDDEIELLEEAVRDAIKDHAGKNGGAA